MFDFAIGSVWIFISAICQQGEPAQIVYAHYQREFPFIRCELSCGK
jgi:hypothetical protein